MDEDLLQKLKDWRRNAANLEGLAAFQVFANKVLENIAEVKPTNKDELMTIKGIRDRKFAKYGEQILGLINATDNQPAKPLSVSAYLDFVNQTLSKCRAKIQGEISSVDARDRVIYFSLKDSKDDSVINCLIWKRDYEMCGIKFEVGMEVVLGGYSDIYKPNGRFSFKASLVELVGEGALKKAYDALKLKLEKEGLFAVERKRALPKYPQKIGIITSRQGAVLADFLTNIGKYGFKIKMIDSRVEGAEAITDLLASIKTFKKQDIEVLVIMRGGGSLESLQAFNNELLVREIVKFPAPVIAAIGHDKDVPLVSLAADLEVSTPSIAAIKIGESWKEALLLLERRERNIISSYENILHNAGSLIKETLDIIKDYKNLVYDKYNTVKNQAIISIQNFRNLLSNKKINLNNIYKGCIDKFNYSLSIFKQSLDYSEKMVFINNPERQLDLGYSIVKIGDKIVRKIGDVSIGKELNIRVRDGSVISEVKNINKINKN